MFIPHVCLLFLLPYMVQGMTSDYVDDTNTTAWKFEQFSSRIDSQSSVGGTVHHNLNPAWSVGTLTFRGSSVEIYGVTYKDDWISGCPSIMYFSWPAGSATYTYSDNDTGPDRLFVKATGFNPREISYPVLNPGSSSDSSESMTQSKVKRPIGIIVGSVVGGIVGLFILATGCAVVLRRRKFANTRRALPSIQVVGESKTRSDESQNPGVNHLYSTPETNNLSNAFPISNSMAITALQKQTFNEESNSNHPVTSFRPSGLTFLRR
ncbi:hypothetical protein DL96DRAFT_1781392 [Flagelloscypha sp. PMI_526]|nr:hypothetical protein DL96DRAFT_1781392 [Flagelloscypha sp. PMI_526]